MLSRRLGSAAVLITVTLTLLYLDFWLGTESQLGRPGLVFAAVIILVAGMAAGELAHLMRTNCPGLRIGMASVVAAIMVAICAVPVIWRDYPPGCEIGLLGWSLIGLTTAIGLCFLVEMKQFEQPGQVTDRLARYALIVSYLLLYFSFLLAHRLFRFDNSLGMISMLCLIVTVKLSDSFAYFVGKSMGRNKLAPKLSPGKTIEGAIGSLLGGVAGTALVIYVVAPNLFGVSVGKVWWWFIVYGVVVTIFGILGDLAESLLKRDAATKDSGNWIPGLGGVLDVIDSLVFAAPVSYCLWILGDASIGS